MSSLGGVVLNNEPDKVVWPHEKKGKFTAGLFIES